MSVQKYITLKQKKIQKMARNEVHHEYEKLSTHEHRCCIGIQNKNSLRLALKGTKKKDPTTYSNLDKTYSSAYIQIGKVFCGNKIKNECIKPKATTTKKSTTTNTTISNLETLHQGRRLYSSRSESGFLFDHQKAVVTQRKTKEIELHRNKAPYASCRCCKRLQRTTQEQQHKQQQQVTESSLSSFMIKPLIIKMFPLLIFSSKTFQSAQNTKHKQRRQEEIRSKSIMRLLFTIARLLCILQTTMTTIPIAAAIDFAQEQLQSQSQSQSQFSSPPFLTIGGQSTALTPIEPRIMSLVNRENILKQFQQKISFNNSSSRNASTMESSATTINKPSNLPYLSCSSCQLRKAKNDSLESIKLHILSKLKLKEYPKMEIPRNVPENIIRDYYRKFDHNGRQRPIKSSLPQADTTVVVDSPRGSEINSKKVYASHEDYMLSDDPNTFPQFETLYESNDDEEAAENDDEENPRVKSTYIFPTFPRIRHSRRSDFLSFRFEKPEEMKITRTILHFYIRGREWISEHEPELLKRLEENNARDKSSDIIISVHLALRRANSFNYTHTVQLTESRHSISDGLGIWQAIDLKDLADYWEQGDDPNQIIVIKTSDVWMRYFVVTGTKDVRNEMTTTMNAAALTAYIEVRTENRPGRHRNKRSTSMDCKESDKEERCCRYPLKVNFTSFGWSFVVAPTDFDAYFCNGECKLGFLEQNPHTHIASLSRSASPCCSPTKMSSLTLLYFNTEHNLVISTIPNMTVEKCSCS